MRAYLTYAPPSKSISVASVENNNSRHRVQCGLQRETYSRPVLSCRIKRGRGTNTTSFPSFLEIYDKSYVLSIRYRHGPVCSNLKGSSSRIISCRLTSVTPSVVASVRTLMHVSFGSLCDATGSQGTRLHM